MSVSTVLAFSVILGAGAYAAGRGTASSRASAEAAGETQATTSTRTSTSELPPGHPVVGNSGLPSGHRLGDDAAPTAESTASSVEWKAPARWQTVPSTSTMRLATLRIPRAAGDAEDAEVSITQVGGSIEANAQRWIEQFDAAGQKTARRSVRKIRDLEVTIVELEGTYSGGMGHEQREATGWALVGAIVATPGMPHFIKLTGPAKTVKAARAEFDAMIGSLTRS